MTVARVLDLLEYNFPRFEVAPFFLFILGQSRSPVNLTMTLMKMSVVNLTQIDNNQL